MSMTMNIKHDYNDNNDNLGHARLQSTTPSKPLVPWEPTCVFPSLQIKVGRNIIIIKVGRNQSWSSWDFFLQLANSFLKNTLLEMKLI